ncbi:Elongin-A [Coemansia sp. S146]|nr:Elongin-A [Coemansia sp. S146]
MDSSTPERPCAVPSLKELCQRALVANIERIRHLGVTPQFLVADALAQCTPEQLDTLEHHNPHIVEDNERLWMSHCLRKHRDLQKRLEDGTMGPVPSWRVLYWDMRRQDEIRAQEILQKVRVKSAAVERNVRKIQLSRVPAREIARGGRPGKQAKEMSLVQRMRMDTIAQMEMMGAGNWRRSGTRSDGRVSASRHMSPAGSPAQSPPHSQSYSPPYFSSASSCSPPHSNYSPPYVPELTSNNQCDTGFDIFGDMFGVPSGSAFTKTLPETVVIREQTMMRRKPSSMLAKRKRNDSEMADHTGCRQGEKRSQKTYTGSQEEATPHAEDLPDDTARRRAKDFKMENG